MLAYEMNEDDEAMLSIHLKETFGRADLKRAEFKQFVEMIH
jgi:hypothetical protein